MLDACSCGWICRPIVDDDSPGVDSFVAARWKALVDDLFGLRASEWEIPLETVARQRILDYLETIAKVSDFLGLGSTNASGRRAPVPGTHKARVATGHRPG